MGVLQHFEPPWLQLNSYRSFLVVFRWFLFIHVMVLILLVAIHSWWDLHSCKTRANARRTLKETHKERWSYGSTTRVYHAYVGEITPLKQKDTYALCVPSFMLCCLSDRTLFHMGKGRSMPHEVCGIPRIRRAWGYISGTRSFMASHHCKMSNCGTKIHTLPLQSFHSPLSTIANRCSSAKSSAAQYLKAMLPCVDSRTHACFASSICFLTYFHVFWAAHLSSSRMYPPPLCNSYAKVRN